MVVSHVVILQALITLPAGERESERKRERERGTGRERETGVCGGVEENEEYSPRLGQ